MRTWRINEKNVTLYLNRDTCCTILRLDNYFTQKN